MPGENEIVYLYLDDIIPNRFQPREVFDDRALQELAASIKEHGVIQPIIVRNIGQKYEIIAGERRYKASAIAGLTKIPAIIRNLDDKESSKVALLENLQRKDLNAIEEARTYQKILEIDEMTQEELAKTMGKSQSAIANKMRLLSLPDEIQEAILQGKISERHARSLLALDKKDEQIKMLNEIISKKMPVRELDQIIKTMKEDINPDNKINGNPLKPNEGPRFINFDFPAVNNDTDNINNINNQVDPILNNPNQQITDVNNTADLDLLLNLPKENIADSTKKEEKDLQQQLDDKLKTIDIKPIKNKQIEKNNNTIVTEENENDNDIEVLFPEETSSTSVTSINNSQLNEGYNLKSAINDTRDFIKKLEHNGLVITTEEMDLENLYQIVIKIDKNK